MPRQSDYPLKADPDAIDEVLLCENPNTDPVRGTQRAKIGTLSGRTTLISADYTVQYHQESILADSSSGPINVTIPEGLPDDSRFSVTKYSRDQNLVSIFASGTEVIQPIRFPILPRAEWPQNSGFIFQADAVQFVKNGTAWYSDSHSLAPYVEVFYIEPANLPIDLTPGQSLLPITLHPELDQSYLFTNVNGLLTSIHPIECHIELQVSFSHTIAANNSDVWARVSPVTNSTHPANVVVSINAAFAHSRAGTFGDTRLSTSIAELAVNDTLGVYGEEVESTGVSTSDIDNLLLSISLW